LRLVTGQALIDLHRRHLGAKMRDAALEISLPMNSPAWCAV
jgi:RNA polymerase sigma-70 factor (ECF subfamily)